MNASIFCNYAIYVVTHSTVHIGGQASNYPGPWLYEQVGQSFSPHCLSSTHEVGPFDLLWSHGTSVKEFLLPCPSKGKWYVCVCVCVCDCVRR